ncbi:MAG: FAD/NAD(P)-binding protein [Planctomycetota bacterium]|nr:MAG: FAD/NAD(P)-binding protein [Planctomycetota bacterium]
MKDVYYPDIALIDTVRDETGDVKTLRMRFKNPDTQKNLSYRSGQFFEVSIFGIGEMPISITSTPSRKAFFELSVKNVGLVSAALHRLPTGSEVGIRGPFGNGFPYEEVFGKNLLFVGGGIGLAPLRSLINNVLDNRDNFGKVIILYGARTPGDLVFKDEFKWWESQPDVTMLLTVDRGDEKWTGNVGVVTTLFPRAGIMSKNAVAFVCGPPVMIPFVIRDLLELGFTDDTIISTLERHMKCGVGKCGHCCIGHKYVCIDGPVFTYHEMKVMTE